MTTIKDGTRLTIEIVKSLRTFTGLNQAEFKEFSIKDAINATLAILKSKMREITAKVEVEENLTLTGNLVGINQVFLNLISISKILLKCPSMD